jgi:hypothetical protein
MLALGWAIPRASTVPPATDGRESLNSSPDGPGRGSYRWRRKGRFFFLSATAFNNDQLATEGFKEGPSIGYWSTWSTLTRRLIGHGLGQ